ncbi:hypothetical protein R3W88_033188 [Solanum pinnatisectum]|uniref:Uncharacterized protein n=1 Tax=Solanum pinnatisectum TaxID=50273 RepID=A0AAV9K222_9SOLN|nr:hypothetical protein R3W88_033188 [Solanum pinnatisectum]
MPIKRNDFKMHQRIVQQMLLVLYFLLSYNGVEGQKKPSKLEDAELEKQLKSLNKPAVKTIKIFSFKNLFYYTCKFLQTRAFDHPLLKEHNFHPEMKPTLSRINKDSTFSSATNRSSTIWSKDGGCPFGTIPVNKIKKYAPARRCHILHYLMQSNNNCEPNGRYISSQGYKVVYVYKKFKGQQHNESRLKIHKGSYILQVGWRAGKIHCFNTLCPVFVQVNYDLPLDNSFMDTISQRGGRPWGARMYIDRSTRPEPLMGSSYFPIENSSYDAYCAGVIIFNEKGKTIEVDKTITHIDNPNMYKVEFIQFSYGAKNMYFVLYEGPGESTHV